MSYPPPAMSVQTVSEPQTLAQVPFKILEEILRQLRSTRNDIIRYGVWNTRNLTDEEFNHADDRKLLGYFRQDLLETRFLSKGRRVDLIQLWHWFDDQMTGTEPMLINGEEHFVNVQDKDLDKVRKRISEIQSFLPTLRSDGPRSLIPLPCGPWHSMQLAPYKSAPEPAADGTNASAATRTTSHLTPACTPRSRASRPR